jgi:hypothetical protein
MDVVASAEADDGAGVAEARLLSDTAVVASSLDEVTEADGREDVVAVGVCERSEGLSS